MCSEISPDDINLRDYYGIKLKAGDYVRMRLGTYPYDTSPVGYVSRCSTFLIVRWLNGNPYSVWHEDETNLLVKIDEEDYAIRVIATSLGG